MKKKIVIFDLDGTLTDTLQSIQITTNLVLEKFGLEPYELEPYRYFVGDGAKELVRRAFVKRGCKDEKRIQLAQEYYQEVFKTYCLYEVKPYDGILELIKACKDAGILLAVNSNKPHSRTVEVVETIFGKGTFDCIVGQSSEREKKPAPDGIYLILETLGLSKDEAVYMGDTSTDMKTGHNAGLFTVGVLWGFRDRAELEAYHADAIIEQPMEMMQFF